MAASAEGAMVYPLHVFSQVPLLVGRKATMFTYMSSSIFMHTFNVPFESCLPFGSIATIFTYMFSSSFMFTFNVPFEFKRVKCSIIAFMISDFVMHCTLVFFQVTLLRGSIAALSFSTWILFFLLLLL